MWSWPRIAVAALVGGAAGVYFLRPGRSLSTARTDLEAALSGEITLDDGQLQMVNIIRGELGSAGLAWLVPACVANAYAESRLDPMAIGDGGRSVGLFQLNVNGGGSGMTTEERQDPRRNAARFAELCGASAELMGMRGSLSHSDLAAEVARLVERCWECGYGGGNAQLVVRHKLVAKLFGDETASSVPS